MISLREFEVKVQECIRKAEKMFGVDMSMVEVHLNLKGQMAGQCCVRTLKATGNRMRYQLYFNPEAIRIDEDHMVNSTIPHEVAHMVGFIAGRHGFGAPDPEVTFSPRLISGHNDYWRRTSTLLGDIDGGTRCHSMPLKKSKEHRRHLYVIPQTSEEFKLTTIIHNRIQRGQHRHSLRTKQYILPDHYRGECD